MKTLYHWYLFIDMIMKKDAIQSAAAEEVDGSWQLKVDGETAAVADGAKDATGIAADSPTALAKQRILFAG